MDFRAFARTAADQHGEEHVELEPASEGQDLPHSCSYCGAEDFENPTDNGRVTRVTCATCGGTMTSHGGAWQPDLIGQPDNHPKQLADPGAAGDEGRGIPIRVEDLSSRSAAVDWCRHRHGGHCWIPRHAGTNDVALYIPQDRGACPWITEQQQMINCPVSEPGPMAGMTRAGVRLMDDGKTPLVPVKHVGYAGHVEAYRGHFDEMDEMDRRIDGHPPLDDDEKPVGHHTPLINFLAGEHSNNDDFWTKHSKLEKVDLKSQPIYATQPHVVQHHLDRYTADPGDATHAVHQNGATPRMMGNLANHAPLFVRHEGAMYAAEGHHRTGSAMQRGETHVNGFVYDADKHGWPEESFSMFEDPAGGHHPSLRRYAAVASCAYQHDDPVHAAAHAIYNHDDGICVATEARRGGMTRESSLTALDDEGRWHFLAAWRDVRAKAKRIRGEGGVSIVSNLGTELTGHVNGDTGVYETQINYVPGTYKIGFWLCGCAWASYSWGRSPAYRRFEGRMCSHALALQYEAQSRGMFGREVREDTSRPSWLRDKVRVRHDRETKDHDLRAAALHALDPDGVYPTPDAIELERAPVHVLAKEAGDVAGDPAEALKVYLALGVPHDAARGFLDDLGPIRRIASDDVWWHGTATGDLRGGSSGLHVGTHRAATQALTARIGHPVVGEWDGSRAYGETLLAGKRTLNDRKISITGHNCGVPDHDHYPDPKGHFPHDSHVTPESKPRVFPLLIHGPMSNSPHRPMRDSEANRLMARQRGSEDGVGCYYRNVGEDEGSVSAVVPHRSHIEPISRGSAGVDYHGTSRYHQPLTDHDYDDPDGEFDDHDDEDWHHHGSKKDDDAPTHAGVALKAADTGRVVMIQRSNKDQKDPARGTWEFPGGGREDGDHHSLHSAIREFEEEVGQPFPLGGHVSHVWRSGPYQGHVVVVPDESCIDFSEGRQTTNPDDPDGDDHEQSAWLDPEKARKYPDLRPECKGSPWSMIKAAGRETDFGSLPDDHEIVQQLSEDYRHHGEHYRLHNDSVTAFKGNQVNAYVRHGKNYRPVGYLSWFGGEAQHDGSNVDGGVISKVYVDPKHRRAGLATAMLQFGRTKRPDLRHSNALSEDGKAWSEKNARLEAFRRKVADYASHDALEDVGVDWRPKPPTKPMDGQAENPGSTGWATSGDPDGWDGAVNNAETLSLNFGGARTAAAEPRPGPHHVIDDDHDQESGVHFPAGSQVHVRGHYTDPEGEAWAEVRNKGDRESSFLRAHNLIHKDDFSTPETGPRGSAPEDDHAREINRRQQHEDHALTHLLGPKYEPNDFGGHGRIPWGGMPQAHDDSVPHGESGHEQPRYPHAESADSGSWVDHFDPHNPMHHQDPLHGGPQTPDGLPIQSLNSLSPDGRRFADKVLAYYAQMRERDGGLVGSEPPSPEPTGRALRHDGELHQPSEPALPSTTADDEGDDVVESPGERYRSQMIPQIDDATSVTPSDGRTAGVSDTVARFQASAAGQALASGAGSTPNKEDSMDIAQAARDHIASRGAQSSAGISRTAVKQFNALEQQELIQEGGSGARARNFSDLKIAGTHYADIARVLEENGQDAEILFL